MIPLRVRIQLGAIEVVVVDECRLGLLPVAAVRLDPGVGSFAEVARQADEREAVVPRDGDQGDHAPRAAVVGHDDAPPFAGGSVHNAALMQPEPAVVGLGAQGRSARHAQRLTLNHALDLPRAFNGISSCHHLIHRSTGNGGHIDILAVDLVQVVAFAHPTNECPFGSIGVKAPQVWGQFLNGIRTAAAGDDVDSAVVIKEDRQVVPSGQLVARPRTMNRLGAEDLEAHAVDVGEDIEHALVIADAGRPDTLAVDVPSFEPERRAQVQPIHAVAGEFPVHQILGMHDLNGRVHVHGGAGEVVVLAHTNNIGILELLVEQRIGVGTIAVVGGPMPGRRGRQPG